MSANSIIPASLRLAPVSALGLGSRTPIYSRPGTLCA